MKFGRLSMVAAAYLLIPCGFLLGAGGASSPDVLTFFGWSDQHVQTTGDAAHLLSAIDAMNAMPGTKYPDRIGGEVGRPAFIFGCGDITEWATNAAKDSYQELITKRLNFPSYDILGNHDEGGKVPSETMKRWMIARHQR